MTPDKRYAALVERAEKSVAYWSEEPVVEFIDSLCRLMKRRNIKRAELARRLGTSRAYVTKLLSGNANFTLATMVKVAMAVEGALHTHVADKEAIVHWVENFIGERPKVVRFDAGNSVAGLVETYVRQEEADSETVTLAALGKMNG